MYLDKVELPPHPQKSMPILYCHPLSFLHNLVELGGHQTIQSRIPLPNRASAYS